MRTRIPVTFTAGTRSISTGVTDLTIEDIRLIVNETQMEVLCSSMQKPLITSVTNGVVTYVTSYQVINDDGTTTTVTIPPLATGDKITFEIDQCKSEVNYQEVTSTWITAMIQRLFSNNSN